MAVGAALLSECAGVAGGAFVDGDGSSWLPGGDLDGGEAVVVSSPVGGGFAGVGAVALPAIGCERLVADGTDHRDVIVTQRAFGFRVGPSVLVGFLVVRGVCWAGRSGRSCGCGGRC